MNEKTKNALLSIVASLVCIVIGLLVGFIILYCINAVSYTHLTLPTIA